MAFSDRIWAAQTLARPGALMARVAGCAFWVARYTHRDDVFEWDVDWSNLPRHGLTELVLVCPNNQIAVLGNLGGQDMAERFFQFKIGVRHSAGAGEQLAQVIGRIDGPNGACTLYAWEPAYTIRHPERYQEPANDGSGGIVWRERVREERHNGRLVGPLTDNFFRMSYHGAVTRDLNQDVLGVRAD